MKKCGLLAAMLFVPVLAFGQPGKSETKSEDARTFRRAVSRQCLAFTGLAILTRSHAHTKRRPGGSSALMTYHGGKIMTTAVTENIFWGTSWTSNPGDKISGLDTWYTGFSGSNYAKTSDEYTGTNGQVGPTITHLGHAIDGSPSEGWRFHVGDSRRSL